jgi:hypothetical protein
MKILESYKEINKDDFFERKVSSDFYYIYKVKNFIIDDNETEICLLECYDNENITGVTAIIDYKQFIKNYKKIK